MTYRKYDRSNDQARWEFESDLATVDLIRRTGAHNWREFSAAPRLYVSTNDSILQNLEDRRRRPYTLWKKLLPSAVASVGLDLDMTPLRWSQYAGCSCACSPGFILPRQSIVISPDAERGMPFFDVVVTLKGAPTVDERKPARVPVLI